MVDRNRERLREWLPWVDPSRMAEDTRAYIRSCLESEGKQLSFGIYVGGAVVGSAGLEIDPENRSAMIGYWLDASFEGRGLVTEASRALCQHAFEELGLHRVWISVDPANVRSLGIPERLGFREEGRFREDMFLTGRFRDTIVYGLLEDEWRSHSG